MGSEPTAAGGGRKEASEWPRSIKSRISVSPKILSGTATGRLGCRPQKGETSFVCNRKDFGLFIFDFADKICNIADGGLAANACQCFPVCAVMII